MKRPGRLKAARQWGVEVSRGILPHASREELIQQVCFLAPLLDEGFLRELLLLLNRRLDRLLVKEEARAQRGEVGHA